MWVNPLIYEGQGWVLGVDVGGGWGSAMWTSKWCCCNAVCSLSVRCFVVKTMLLPEDCTSWFYYVALEDCPWLPADTWRDGLYVCVCVCVCGGVGGMGVAMWNSKRRCCNAIYSLGVRCFSQLCCYHRIVLDFIMLRKMIRKYCFTLLPYPSLTWVMPV